MAFEQKLSVPEKVWIVEHSEPAMVPQMSHGNVAKILGRLFKETNFGRRSRITVYRFRVSEEFQYMARQHASGKAFS